METKLLIGVIAGGVAASGVCGAQTDTLQARQLQEVKIEAFATSRTILETNASVGLVGPAVLKRFGEASWLNAVNTVPGVRMEERSPGSYRFSVRGSLMRSPFGVRNVKFYWNGIPFTDAGGNTPLNILDFASVGRMEIIKGPGSSLYGAGTGGVVSMYNDPGERTLLEQSVSAGKYGYQSRNTLMQAGNFQMRYGHQEQDGYRQQSRMVRDAISFFSQFKAGKGKLSLTGIYSDLFYQTPGGVTLAQYNQDPTLARQPTGTVPGSVGQNARISTRYVFVGGSYILPLSDSWTQSTSLAMSTNHFANPFITNYEKREEQGLSGRNYWQYRPSASKLDLNWTSGFEWQFGRSAQRNYDNMQGSPGSQQSVEDLSILGYSVFSQVDITLPHRFLLATGISYNDLHYTHEQYFPGPYSLSEKRFEGQLMPRIALSKVFLDRFSVGISTARGFSPPTIQEVRPSAGGFRKDLEAETGWNHELILRYASPGVLVEVSAYRFGLNQTIVRQTNESGAEFFLNAGKTDQKGVEWKVEYELPVSDRAGSMKLWHSGNYADYHFRDYRSGTGDVSGNQLPGVPRFAQSTGLQWEFLNGFRVDPAFSYIGILYLNDANTVKSTPVRQWNIRVSWSHQWGRRLYSEVSGYYEKVSADVYSLGFDINSFGNRYYNASPKNNLWAGVKLGWRFR